MKPVYTFRLDKELVEKSRAAGINIAKLIELTLSKKIGVNKCPYCGSYKKDKG